MWGISFWSQKIEASGFPADFCTWIFLGRVSRYAATTSISALFPSHCYSDIRRFRSLSPTGNGLNPAEKFQNCSTTITFYVLNPRSGISGPRRASARQNLNEWRSQPTHVRRPKCSSIVLAEIRRSFRIISWILFLLPRVVTVLGRPGRGTRKVEKSPRLTCTTQFLAVAYDGACSPNVSVRMVWISLGALPSKKNKFMTVRVCMLLKSSAPPDMLPFCLCNNKRLAIRRTSRPHFPTTLPIPSYNIGKYLCLRTYQNPSHFYTQICCDGLWFKKHQKHCRLLQFDIVLLENFPKISNRD